MDTIGHETVKQRFHRTLARGRLASTYLFVGDEGVGKRTFALGLARLLLCQSPTTGAEGPQACGRCESCRLTDEGAHPDLLRVAKPPGKSTLPLELFLGRPDHRNREGLCHDIALRPYLAKRRIAVIDDADALGVESANCLLKTLEEPPPRSVLILIGTSLSKQLPTIRSRSQVVRFSPMAKQEVAAVLQSTGLVDTLIEDEQTDRVALADQLAERSGGSLSRALAAAVEELSAFRARVEQVLSDPDFDPVRLAAAVNELCQAGSPEPSVRRSRLQTVIGFAIDHYREQLRNAAAASDQKLSIIDLLDRSLDAFEAVERNANQATVIQAWLTELAAGRRGAC